MPTTDNYLIGTGDLGQLPSFSFATGRKVYRIELSKSGNSAMSFSRLNPTPSTSITSDVVQFAYISGSYYVSIEQLTIWTVGTGPNDNPALVYQYTGAPLFSFILSADSTTLIAVAKSATDIALYSIVVAAPSSPSVAYLGETIPGGRPVGLALHTTMRLVVVCSSIRCYLRKFTTWSSAPDASPKNYLSFSDATTLSSMISIKTDTDFEIMITAKIGTTPKIFIFQIDGANADPKLRFKLMTRIQSPIALLSYPTQLVNINNDFIFSMSENPPNNEKNLQFFSRNQCDSNCQTCYREQGSNCFTCTNGQTTSTGSCSAKFTCPASCSSCQTSTACH